MTLQTNTIGEHLSYSYFNTGKLGGLTQGDHSSGTETFTANYGYDVSGNRTIEIYLDDDYSQLHWYPADQLWDYIDRPYTIENATATYDALNRLTSYSDSGYTGLGGSFPMSLSYEYDTAGNVRRMASSYMNVVTATTSTQEYWYKYDALNRVVTTKGSFTGSRGSGTIARGSTGTDLSYDVASERVTATSTVQVWDGFAGTVPADHREDFVYGEDGYLTTVKIAEGTHTTPTVSSPGITRATDTRDAMGRVTSHTEYLSDGTTVEYSRTVTYNNKSLVTADTVTSIVSGNYYVATTAYDYNLETTTGSGVWTGAYGGGGLIHSRTTNTKNGVAQPTTDLVNTYWHDGRSNLVTYTPDTAHPTTTYVSGYNYDSLGRLSSVGISDGRPRTIVYRTDLNNQVRARIETGSGSAHPKETR